MTVAWLVEPLPDPEARAAGPMVLVASVDAPATAALLVAAARGAGCEAVRLAPAAPARVALSGTSEALARLWATLPPALAGSMAALLERIAEGSRPRDLPVGPATLPLGRRTLLMGVVNTSPESFSGDAVPSLDAAVDLGLALAAAGADMLDVGGASTRPGAPRPTPEEEVRRVVPVISRLRSRLALPISVDTVVPGVAAAALHAGATMVNDVSGLAAGPEIARLAAHAGAALIVGHWPASPWQPPDPVVAVTNDLATTLAKAEAAGMPRERLLADPGLGFAKSPAASLAILARLGELRTLGVPIVVGPSRKGFIGRVLNLPVEDREEGTMAAVALAVVGGAAIVRVHDLRAMARVARMTDAILHAAL